VLHADWILETWKAKFLVREADLKNNFTHRMLMRLLSNKGGHALKFHVLKEKENFALFCALKQDQ
jgi:hypothetical protein